MNNPDRKIFFRNVGKMDQYEVDLFSIAERPFNIEPCLNASQSYAEEQLTHYKEQVTM